MSRYSAWKPLHLEVQPLLNFALSHFPAGVVLQIQLARIQLSALIAKHSDSSSMLGASYRLHIPIATRDNIHFKKYPAS